MMIKMHKIYIPFLLAIGLVLNSPQLHAATDLEIAEMVTACGYLPATIIELATNNKSEKRQLQGKIAADALRFAHTALATISHTDDWRANKYHLVWAAIHGYSLVNNIHKLSNYQELLAPAPTTGKAFAQKPISQTKNYKEKAANAARIILSLCKTACALVTANGGVPKHPDNDTYYGFYLNINTYSKALSSNLLSITECLDQCISEKNSYKKGGWLAAFAAHAYLTTTEFRKFSDEHREGVDAEQKRLLEVVRLRQQREAEEQRRWEAGRPQREEAERLRQEQLKQQREETARLAREQWEAEKPQREEAEKLARKAQQRQQESRALFINRAINPNADCPICYSHLGSNVIRFMPCGHDFHPACKALLQMWQNEKRLRQDCPVCEEIVTN